MKRKLLVGIVAAVLVLSNSPAKADPPTPPCKDSTSICLIKKYWQGNDAEALRVADCESGYEPSARRTGSQYTGVFQIGVETHAERIQRVGREMQEGVPYYEKDMYDAGKNTAVAWDLFKSSGGWGPWECKP